MASELKLIKKAKRGNKSAFGTLITSYQDKILYLAFDYLGNYEEAKDAAQDTFMKAFENLNTFDHQSEFKTWLYRIAVNTCIDQLRKKRSNAENVSKLEKTLVAESTLENFIWDDKFIYALKTLSEKQHSAIVLKYFHDKSTKEISAILKCDINTVRIHLHRAILKLKKIYQISEKQ